MAVSEDFLQFVLDQLSEFGEVEAKKMFGGVGFFHEGLMFGMIGYDAFRLKADATTQADYESRGMSPHTSPKKGKGMPYWEVPTEVLEDRHELKKWAQKAYDVALRAKR